MVYILATVLFFLVTVCPSISIDNDYPVSNFKMEPSDVRMHSTDSMTILCTKKIDDGQDIEVSGCPAVSFERLTCYRNQHNTTMLEITVNSFGYMGKFLLTCSGKDTQSNGIQADVTIGDMIDELTQIGSCIVDENHHIDCVIRSTTIVNSNLSNLTYEIKFGEIDAPSMGESAYRLNPEQVHIDDQNKTVTYRWLPSDEGVFPLGLKMMMMALMHSFGEKNLTIDMTPKFRIKPNFTIELITTNSFQIRVNHHVLPASSFCYGNLTFDDPSRLAKPEDDIRRFRTIKSSWINITHLLANTQYQLCMKCYGDQTRQTINTIQCQRIRTKAHHWWKYLAIIAIAVVILMIIIIIVLWKKSQSIKRKSVDESSIHHSHPDSPIIVLIPASTSYPVNTSELIPLQPLFSNGHTLREIPRTERMQESTDDDQVSSA